MKSTYFSIKFLDPFHDGSTRYVASLALLMSAMAFGCASTKVVAEKPISPVAKSNSSASAKVAKVPTADELLRARLDAVMKESEALRASRSSVASMASNPTRARVGTMVSGRLAPELIQQTVRANFGKFRECYETGLKKRPYLSGRVAVKFVIGQDGAISQVSSKDSDLPDENVVACIVKAFSTLKFPAPEGGIVTVVYPIMFSPGDDPPAASRPAAAPPPPAAPPPLPTPAPSAITAPEAGASYDEHGKSDSGPIITIEGSVVRVNGVIVGDTRSILEANRLTILDVLFDELKVWRVHWKALHPDKPFVGAAGLRTDPTTPNVVFKSVFQTIAFAGYPDIFVQSATEPKQISEFIAQVPGPPDSSVLEEPPPVLQMHVTQDEVALLWKKAATIINEERIPRKDPTLAANICASWKTFGRHPEATDDRRDAVILHSDNGLPWQDVAVVARAAEACVRDVQHPDGHKERMPVFWTIFSVR